MKTLRNPVCTHTQWMVSPVQPRTEQLSPFHQTAPITKTQSEQMNITQRKMLRLIAGYIKHDDDSWADMYRDLRRRIEDGQTQKPIQ